MEIDYNHSVYYALQQVNHSDLVFTWDDDDSDEEFETEQDGVKQQQQQHTLLQCGLCSSHSSLGNEVKDQDDDEEFNLALNYIHFGARASQSQIADWRSANLSGLLQTKKLVLVLDLDETLLHSVSLEKFSFAELSDLYKTMAPSSLDSDQQDSPVFVVDEIGFAVKLRPGVRWFLREASSFCEMYIYTKGTRDYARAMVKLLDPDNKYFDARVIAREDYDVPGKKSLDIVPDPEQLIIVVDDLPQVWVDHQRNLVTVAPYEYFSVDHWRCGGGEDKELSRVLAIIRRVHSEVYRLANVVDISERDVRQVLDKIHNPKKDCSYEAPRKKPRLAGLLEIAW